MVHDLPDAFREFFNKVDELDKAISVAERDPAFYGLNEVEIGRRRSWTSSARNQVFFTGLRILLSAASMFKP